MSYTIFAIDNAGDLAVDSNGHFLIPVTEIGKVVALRLRNRLLLIQGTWFLDLGLGFEWQTILGAKGLSIPTIQTKFREFIAATPDVIRVPRCDARIDRASRTLFIDFEAIAADGSVITGFENLSVNGASVYAPSAVDVDPLSFGFVIGDVSP